jgi:transcriptional regulator with XRE-family HTH domain
MARNPDSQLHFKNRTPGSFDLNTFGGRIGYALLLANRTQADVAGAIGITTSSVSGLCRMNKPRTSSRNIPEIASFLGVPNDWLAYGIGEAPTRETIGRPPRPSATPQAGKSGTASERNSRLSDMQAATLGKLELLMVSGAFNDMDCLELLTGLKPKLASL